MEEGRGTKVLLMAIKGKASLVMHGYFIDLSFGFSLIVLNLFCYVIHWYKKKIEFEFYL